MGETSLAVQWLRLHLPMQGVRVRSLVWSGSYDPTCLVAEKPKHKKQKRASLVAQWLRVCLLVQGTRVRALVWEDPTCHGAAGPVSHNY